MRKERVILKDGVDIPFIGGQPTDLLSMQVDLSGGGLFKTGDQP